MKQINLTGQNQVLLGSVLILFTAYEFGSDLCSFVKSSVQLWGYSLSSILYLLHIRLMLKQKQMKQSSQETGQSVRTCLLFDKQSSHFYVSRKHNRRIV